MRERRADVATALTPLAAMRNLLALLPLASASYDVFGASITGPLDETSCNIVVGGTGYLPQELLDELTATTSSADQREHGRALPYWARRRRTTTSPRAEQGGGHRRAAHRHRRRRRQPVRRAVAVLAVRLVGHEPTTDWVDHTTTPEEVGGGGVPVGRGLLERGAADVLARHVRGDPDERVGLRQPAAQPGAVHGVNGHVWAAIYEENCLLRTAGRSTARATGAGALRLFSGMRRDERTSPGTTRRRSGRTAPSGRPTSATSPASSTATPSD